MSYAPPAQNSKNCVAKMPDLCKSLTPQSVREIVADQNVYCGPWSTCFACALSSDCDKAEFNEKKGKLDYKPLSLDSATSRVLEENKEEAECKKQKGVWDGVACALPDGKPSGIKSKPQLKSAAFARPKFV